MSKPERLIHIERWDDFQHYGKREAPWIKVYTRLLDDHKYLALTHAQRAVLHGLWLAYAKTHREVPDSTRWLSRYLSLKVTRPMLDSLNHAGFISFRASSPLAERYQLASPEGEGETERESKTVLRAVDGLKTVEGFNTDIPDFLAPPRQKQDPDKVSHDARYRKGDNTARYTGARWVRGANGSGGQFLHDPLGIDHPPEDWPHPPPTALEIVAARRAQIRAA